MATRALTTYDELMAASDGDPFVRWMVDPHRPARGWGFEQGVAWVWRTPHWREQLPVVASAEAPISGDRPALADAPAAGTGTLEATRRDAERDAIITALAKSGNNRVMAARLLGISRRGLYHKLGEYGLL